MSRDRGRISSGRVVAHERAADLPAGWDGLCASLLQTRALLDHYETTNPCGQRYYVMEQAGRPVAGAVVYTIVQNLFTFLGNLPSPVRLNVVGLPASVPPGGVVGSRPATDVLLPAVFAAEKGLTIALNLPADQAAPGAIPLRMLPEMEFRGRHTSLDSYQASLRSAWRRRVRRSRDRFTGVETVRTPCGAFGDDHYALYRAVLARATERLETLTSAFFRGLPPPLELVSCRRDGVLLCWRIVLREQGRLMFVLGGHDYALNGRYDLYFNNLLGVLADGFACGATAIDLGQTAEDAKARLGATPVETRMLLHHANPFIGVPLRAAAPLIAYRGQPRTYRTFRREDVAS